MDRSDPGGGPGAGAHAPARLGRGRLPLRHQQRGRQHDAARAAAVVSVPPQPGLHVLRQSQRYVQFTATCVFLCSP